MGTRWEISVAARPVRVRRVEAFCATPDRKAPVLPPCANVTTYEFGRNYIISLVGLDRRSARSSNAPVACRTSCNGDITHQERSSGNSGCQIVGDHEGDNQHHPFGAALRGRSGFRSKSKRRMHRLASYVIAIPFTRMDRPFFDPCQKIE